MVIQQNLLIKYHLRFWTFQSLTNCKKYFYEKNNVSRGQLLDAQAIVAFMGDDFYFDSEEVSFRVISYDVTFTKTEGTFTRENKGALFNETAKSAIRNTANDGMITISNIKVKELDGALIESLPESKSYTITG